MFYDTYQLCINYRIYNFAISVDKILSLNGDPQINPFVLWHCFACFLLSFHTSCAMSLAQ